MSTTNTQALECLIELRAYSEQLSELARAAFKGATAATELSRTDRVKMLLSEVRERGANEEPRFRNLTVHAEDVCHETDRLDTYPLYKLLEAADRLYAAAAQQVIEEVEWLAYQKQGGEVGVR